MSKREDLQLPVVRLYRNLVRGEQIVVFGDPADSKDFCAAVAFSKKFYDCPLIYNQVTASSQFGYDLNNFCKYIYNQTSIWPKLGVERNTGQATIFVLKTLNYPDLFRMVDFSAAGTVEGGDIGWVTTGSWSGGELQGTRRKMLDDLSLAITQNQITLYDEQQILQLKSFQLVRGRAQARSNKHDDLVIATAGAWQLHLTTPSIDWDDYDEDAMRQKREKWRFK